MSVVKGHNGAAEPSTGSLVLAVALGAASALWSMFLWAELMVSRLGAKPFCALGEGFDCSSLWDGPFAGAIHGATGVPVAGWGLIWSVVAAGIPLFALWRRGDGEKLGAVTGAMKLVAFAGALSLVGLIAVAVSAKIVCLGCIGTYVLVGGYGVLVLFVWRDAAFGAPTPALGTAVAGTAVAFVCLLYPGLSTPKTSGAATRDALQEVAEAPVSADAGTASVVADFLSRLPASIRQTVSDARYQHQTGKTAPPRPARVILGDQPARLTVVEWTDIRCGHCAELHSVLEEIHGSVPPGSFNVEPRHFPLDGSCNPVINRQGDGVSCIAAKAQICMEGSPDKLFRYAKALFQNQRSLDAESVLKLAEPYMERSALEACIQSSETASKLSEDIEYALQYDPHGTPVVAINGRSLPSVGAYLYALIAGGGDMDHPAYASLPPPNKQAHIH